MNPKNNDTNTASDSEGARRATGESLAGKISTPDPEVIVNSERRRFTSKYKLSILAQADQCADGPGEIGALLRREGLYSSHLSNLATVTPQWDITEPGTTQTGPKSQSPCGTSA